VEPYSLGRTVHAGFHGSLGLAVKRSLVRNRDYIEKDCECTRPGGEGQIGCMSVKSRIEMQRSVLFIARVEREIEPFSLLSIEFNGCVSVNNSAIRSFS
jgi:hypothetical protein